VILSPERTLERAVVLVVDDDPTTRLLMKESLQAGGFEVVQAANGDEGFRLYQECAPDMILMDVLMPGINGYDVCERIRALPGGDRVPILMATSLDDMHSIHRAYEAGASDFVTKPINWSLLAHRVRYMVRAGQTFERFRRMQAKNQALLDAIPDLICRHRLDGELLECKTSRETRLGDVPRPLDGFRLNQLLPDGIAGEVLDAASAALTCGATQVIEVRLDQDRTTRFLEARIVACGDQEVLTILRDITERKSMEEQLRSSEEHFRSLIENAPDLITVLGPHGSIRYGSPAVERVLGYSTEDLLGGSIYDIVHPDDSPALRNDLALALAEPGTPRFNQLRFSDRCGECCVMESICTAIRNDQTGEMAVVMNSRDITERLATQQALRDSEDQLRHSQKMEAIGRLAGGVAHDFNNLLTAILGYSQILDERLRAEGFPTEDLDEIRKAGDRATALTRQLLTFSRRQLIQPRIVDLNVILHDTRKMLRRLLGEDIQLETRLSPDLHPAMVDPGQIEQVVMNLAVNARDAMPNGGTLLVESANAESDGSGGPAPGNPPAGSFVVLSISDTGTGIPAEDRRKIFEPFFTTKEDGQGTGLGLSTVYGIVKQNGGEIVVESEPGSGATFRIYLPRADEKAKEDAAEPPRNGGLQGTETILLVEDEEWVRTLVRQCLERCGYTVLEAEHGEHAMTIHERYKGAIQLLLTDVVMPGLNGVKLAEALAGLRPSLRTLYMSGYSDHAVFRDSRIQSGGGLLAKPFTIEDLAARVRDAIDAAGPLAAVLP
jgi:PAS domain S-box-containing protein